MAVTCKLRANCSASFTLRIRRVAYCNCAVMLLPFRIRAPTPQRKGSLTMTKRIIATLAVLGALLGAGAATASASATASAATSSPATLYHT